MTKRIFSLLLALLLCAGSVIGLVSCMDSEVEGNDSDSVADSESESITEDTPTGSVLNLVTEGKSDFVIIVPTDSDLFTQSMVDAVNILITPSRITQVHVLNTRTILWAGM